MGMFQNSLKKWFYQNSSQAASSDARIPLLDASGNPKGSDTMANIASAMGVSPAVFKAKQYGFATNSIVEIPIQYGFVFLGAGTGRYNFSYVSKYTSLVTDIATSSSISHTKDTDGKVNVYFENQKLYAQNKTGATQVLDVCVIGNGV